MATGCDEEIDSDRIRDENSDSVLACHRNSLSIPESMSSAVNCTTNDLGLKDTHFNRSKRLHDNSIATNDICYKDNHHIGSRKVTENIITYHEPIFQSVVNTLYENQKSINMGKRKAEELEKGDIGSPDCKRTKVESPKIDTGFKVKKKCSIENIIERIRNEKTQSRGGMSAASSCEQSVCQPDLVSNTSCVQIGHIASFDKGHTDNIQTASCTKETVSIWPNNGPGSHKASIAQSDVKDILASTDSDKALDLSMKTSNQRNLVPFENAITNSVKIFEKVPMKHGIPTLYKVKCQESLIQNLQKSHKNTSEIPAKVRAGGKEKDLVNTKKIVKKLSGSSKKTKGKANVESLKAAKLNLKQSGVVQSIITHVKKKCVSKSAIETVKGKTSCDKRSENEKCNKSKPVSKKETNSAKSGKKSVVDDREQLRARSTKNKINKSRRQKGGVAVKRVKREASLNAATLVNIFYEKNKSPKLNAKRSKSESDMASSPKKVLMSSQSFTDIVVKGTSNAFDKMNEYKRTDESKVFKSPKKEPVSPTKFHSSPRKHSLLPLHPINNKDMIGKSKGVKKEPSTPKKQKVSLSDEDFDEIFRTVLQEKTETSKCRKEKTTDQLLTRNANPSSLVKIKEKLDKDSIKVETKHSERKDVVNNSRPIEAATVLVPKSEEEIAEKKRKANLARLKKAKELLIAKELQIAKEVYEESETDSESDSESVATDSQISDIVKMNVTVNETKVRAKKGELCRSARTHVHVEAKTVLENTGVAPKWCECCQSTYYPSQPQQGTKVWRIKQLVDKGTKNPPELIQSASHHFIAAHTSCQVRPYSSPTHVSVLDSSPYVAPLMSHGHVGCTACGCRHTGMLHTAQCQNYALLPCQPYSSTYSVSYPHGHSSCPHCGCGTCCGGGSFHAPGQPLIHQSQIPISTEPPILVHHTVPLHDTSHTVPLQLSHNDSGITSCQVPLQISDSNLQQINHCCQLSQGEIVLRTNSQSDHELIDIGRDDVVKTLKQSSPKTSNSGRSSQLVKSLSKGRKNSASNEIKKGASSQITQTNKVLGHQSKEVRKGKTETIRTQVKKQVTSDKDRERKQSDSSKKKRKGSENKVDKSESKSVKGGNSGKTSGKGSKNQQSETKDVEEKKQFSPHGWTWEGEGILKTIINIFDGHPVERKCYPAIRHEDGEIIHVKDCVLVCSGRKEKDIPYVAKVTNFWEDPMTKEMMMTLLWYYRPEHVEGGRRPENQENEVFAAKHRDESLVACIDDRGFVLTYNEYCRFMGEVLRMKHNLPLRKKVVPDPEEPYPSNRIPPVDVDPENVFLCRHVYDLKLKRVLKNPS